MLRDLFTCLENLMALKISNPGKIFDVTPYGVAKTETFKTEPGNPFMESGKKYQSKRRIGCKDRDYQQYDNGPYY